MKTTLTWMVVLAMAVSPLLAQEGEPSQPEEQPQPTEQEQIEAAIEEAMGREGAVTQEAPIEEEVGWEEEAWEEEAAYDESGIEENYQQGPQHREVQTLMTGSGGYGALSLGYSEVNGLSALQMGAQAEWVVGHSFGLGIGGVGFTSDFTPVGSNYYAISGGYGGLILEPIVFGWFPVHVALPVMIGGGGLASYATNSDPWDYGSVDPTFGEYAAFFIAEVGAELEFNLVRFFRLSLFGTYRWTTELKMKPMYGLEPEGSPYPVTPHALNGWSAGVRFKFGSF